ncbi:hypothetical protein K431DRAFT_217020 [Polychaeton citri CBS 116435]|uniref:RNI-like protein n=1 Tax=Polychaeton citri CBS 116435 TaxID=1314669 RepID=A0A9P4QEM9_9PEZI|nr:hypothetical protein K431DRAFT_217020 [Polychaeton citri CBS 116435]
MPGKSNKFDYTKRGTTGPKLGAIISRDLLKKSEEVQKHSRQSDSASGFTRPRSVSATSVSANSQDFPTYVLDLKVPGKALGDEGIAAMVVGLEAAAGSSFIVLEDLDISGNGISVKVLPLLARTIELARFTLKTVNISGNELHVWDPIQMGYWEDFLRAFENCSRLRRLDFSNNLEIGPGAFEVLARLHARESPVDPIPAAGAASVHSLDDDHGKTKVSIPINPLNAPKAMHESQYLRRRCGLRSIPFISFKNVSFDDNCAIWLSYILTDHHFPSQLIDKFNATRADTHVEVYQQQQSTLAQAGFDWAGSESTLSKDGAYLLKLAARVRQHIMAEDHEDLGESSAAPASIQKSTDGALELVRTPDFGEALDDVEKARLKIQRQQISLHGARCGQIWLVTIHAIQSARLMMLLNPIRERFTGKSLFIGAPETLTGAGGAENFQMGGELGQRSAELEGIAHVVPGFNDETSQPNAAPVLTASTEYRSGNPVLPTTKTSPQPILPKLKLPSRPKYGMSGGIETLVQRFDKVIVKNNDPMRFVRYQQQMLAGKEEMYRDISLNLTHLPLHIACKIVEYTLFDWHTGVLSKGQQASAVRWGLTRATLADEMGWRKIDMSAQVLMLLRKVACLTY